jgi:hypothetical protein
MTKAAEMPGLPKAELDKQLDAALEQTFPASDATTIGQPTAQQPDRPLDRRPARLDTELVTRLARNVERKLKLRQR